MKYTSENFHLHYIPQYRLLIKSDFLEDNLIVQDDQQEILALYAYPADKPDAEAVKLLGLPFQHISINLPVQSLLFIPTEVYDSDHNLQYQDFLVDELTQRTQYCTLDNLGITAVFQFDLLLLARWKAIFPEAHFVADFQVILRSILAYLPAIGNVLGLHVKDKQADLYIFQDGKLLLYNVFDTETTDDLHYFILNTCKSIGLPNYFDKVVLSGVDSSHAAAAIARKYAASLDFFTSIKHLETDDAAVQQKLEGLNLIADFPLCAL